MRKSDQHKQIARVERRDAKLARKEGASNLRNAQINRQKRNFILARQQSQEARWDDWWANRRLGIAKRQERMAK
jgi:hypothetical protein